MKTRITKDTVYVKQSAIHNAGRGVFARRDIKKGEHIETCPVIEISRHDMASLNESILVTYFFFHGKDKERVLVSLGFGSLYNHSYIPNAIYQIHPREKTMDFIAIADIQRDSEITFNYKSGNDKNKNPLWFENRNSVL